MFAKSNKIVTAHIVEEQIYLAVVENKTTSPKIECLTKLSLKNGDFEDFIRTYKLKGQAVYLALGGKQIITRIITVPQMSQQELRKALRWEVIKYIPIPPEELTFDFEILETIENASGKQLRIMIIAAKEKYIEKFCDFFVDLGLKPKVVDIEGVILYYLYSSLVKKEANTSCCMYLDDKRVVLSFIAKNKLYFIHNFEWDTRGIFEGLVSEYQRVSSYLQRQMQMSIPSDIYLFGPQATETLRENLKIELNINVVLMYLNEGLGNEEMKGNHLDPSFTFAAGLVLREVD